MSSPLQTPHECMQANRAWRLQRQHRKQREEREERERTKQYMTELHVQRRIVLDTLRGLSTKHEDLVESLERIEAENERWQTPNGNLGEIYRLKDEIVRAEKLVRDTHRRWDELGEQIEEKHVEIAFGGE